MHDYKKTSCSPWLTLIKGILTRKGSHKIRVLMIDLPYKKRPSMPRNRCQPYTTIKTPKSLQTKVHIISPNSGTLELWKFSNLTFRVYLAATTPILSTRSSLFLFRMCCLENVRTMRLTDDFRHFQLAPSEGKSFVSRTTASQTKSCMVLTRSMATTNNNQGDEPRTTPPQKTGSNSCRGSRTPHQAKSWPRGAIAPKEHRA